MVSEEAEKIKNKKDEQKNPELLVLLFWSATCL